MGKKNIFFSIVTILFFIIFLTLCTGCNQLPKYSIAEQKGITPPKNILLITVDTLRADHLGCYGYQKIQTPTIDALAQRGVLFEWAFTPVPLTLPSHASILTGLYPSTHGVLNNGEYQLSTSIKTLPHILQGHGFATAAFIGAFVLSKQFGLNQGFEVYDEEFLSKEEKVLETFSIQASPLYTERKGEKVTKAALKWIKERKPSRFFLWVHYFDPHDPYEPPQPFKDEYSDCLYDGEIAYSDQCIAALLQELEKQNILKETLVVLVGDHGEGLGEHKENNHGIFLYDATMRIPLIFHYPELPEGVVSSDLVTILDISPTILEMLKIPIPPKWQGKSLIPYFDHSYQYNGEKFAIFLETKLPEVNFGWSPLQGVRTRKWKYIHAPRPELYNLQIDPKELNNVINQYPKQAQYLKKRLQTFIKTHPLPQENRALHMSEETRQRLQSLGYVWTTDSNVAKNLSLDPKDMIELLDIFEQGCQHYDEARYPEAINIFHQVLQKNFNNMLARFLLASALEKIGHLEEALKEFKWLANRNPRFNNVHKHIGTVYERLGNCQKALEEYHKDMKLFPDDPSTYNNLGVIYLKLKRYGKAREQFEKVFSLYPDHPTQIVGHTNLGIAYEMLGMYDQAQEEYQNSLDLDPDYVAAHMGAGNVFLKTHQIESAICEWKKALEINLQNAEANYNLGCVFLGQRLFDKAIIHLQEAVRLEPDFFQARMLLEKIQRQYNPDD